MYRSDHSHSVQPPFFVVEGGGGVEGWWVEPPTKFSKRRGGGLSGPQLLEGGCWERGGCNFHKKI